MDRQGGSGDHGAFPAFDVAERSAIAIMAGARELWHWVDQSFRYYRNLRLHGQEPTLHVLPGYGRFDILDEYLNPDSITMDLIKRAVKS